MTLYFKGTVSGEETAWEDTVTGYGNWFEDHAFLGGAHTTIPASRLPEAGDDVVILTAFSGNPYPAIVFHTVVFGNTNPVASPFIDNGSEVRASSGISFRGASSTDSFTLRGDVTLYDSSNIVDTSVTIIGSLTCQDSSTFSSQVVPTGSMTFNGSSSLGGSVDITKNLTFNDTANCWRGGYITGTVTFTGTAYPYCPCASQATSVVFTNDVVFTLGAISGGWYTDSTGWDFQGTCTYIFNGSDLSGVIGGNATFNTGSTFSAGTINGNATFKDGSGGVANHGVIGALANVTFESGSSVGYIQVAGTALFEFGAETSEFWSSGTMSESAEVTTYAGIDFSGVSPIIGGTLIAYNATNFNGMSGSGANAHLELHGASYGELVGTWGSIACYDTTQISAYYTGPLIVIDPIVMRDRSYFGAIGYVVVADMEFYESACAYTDIGSLNAFDGSLTFYGTEYTFNPVGAVTATTGITFPNPVVFNVIGSLSAWGDMAALQYNTFLDTVEFKVSTVEGVEGMAEYLSVTFGLPLLSVKLNALDVLGTGLN